MIEYTLLFGVIAAGIVAMSPMIQRTTQAMVKVVADQVGNQQEAEQGRGLAQLNAAESQRRVGLLINSTSDSTIQKQERQQQAGATIQKTYLVDRTFVNAHSVSDLGFTERQE